MLDLNSATPREIARATGLSLAQAFDLSLWAPYGSWPEVMRTPGVDRNTLRRLRACGAFLGARSEAA